LEEESAALDQVTRVAESQCWREVVMEEAFGGGTGTHVGAWKGRPAERMSAPEATSWESRESQFPRVQPAKTGPAGRDAAGQLSWQTVPSKTNEASAREGAQVRE
jgi:hypothetical protein